MSTLHVCDVTGERVPAAALDTVELHVSDETLVSIDVHDRLLASDDGRQLVVDHMAERMDAWARGEDAPDHTALVADGEGKTAWLCEDCGVALSQRDAERHPDGHTLLAADRAQHGNADLSEVETGP
jgi:hypothetical protein